MDKLFIPFTRPTCMVLDMVFENYTDGFFKFILNYTRGMDGLNKKSDEACERIEEAVSELADGISKYLSCPTSYYYNFGMEIDKWDRVIVFLRNLNIHTVALLADVEHECDVPPSVVRDYMYVIRVTCQRIIEERESKGK